MHTSLSANAAGDEDFPSRFVAGTLASQVAVKLIAHIRQDALVAGTRLPSETRMARHFRVSRTVVRQAIALLKVDGIVSTRRGSGAFIEKNLVSGDPRDERLTDKSIQSLLHMIEVRRGLEAETAALAASRRTPAQLAGLEQALRRIEQAVASGVSGVEEDVAFHVCIAQATGNPYWMKFVQMFAQPIRSAVTVTRANEARRSDFSAQVCREHEKILCAIAAGDTDMARQAAADHMTHAAERVRLADRDFWQGRYGDLARCLDGDNGKPSDTPDG